MEPNNLKMENEFFKKLLKGITPRKAMAQNSLKVLLPDEEVICTMQQYGIYGTSFSGEKCSSQTSHEAVPLLEIAGH